MPEKNKFWNQKLKVLSKFVEIYFAYLSDKYSFLYRDYPIYVKLENKTDYKKIVGDCYKQSLHLSSNNSYYGIMRPEFTHIASQNINLNSSNLYYMGECYRNENTQFLRYQNFNQLGCELFATTLNKGLVTSILSLLHLYEFMQICNFNKQTKYIVHVKTENEVVVEAIEKIYKDFADIQINKLKRIGGEEHNYTYFCFEIHGFDANKPSDKSHELVGGGSYDIKYKNENIYAVGYSVGLERFIYYLTKSQSDSDYNAMIDFIINKYKSYENEEREHYIKANDLNSLYDKIGQILSNNQKTKFNILKK